MTNNRFFVFASDYYYCSNGGMDDYRGSYNSLEEAQTAANTTYIFWDWVSVAAVNAEGELEVVWSRT